MTDVRPCAPKKHADLASEWDRLAEERHRQIASGDDLSFEHILIPTTLALLDGADTALVLDVGSGTGDFTARLARVARRVIGVEPSRASVEVARAVCLEARNVRFVQAPLEEAVGILRGEPATAGVAVMTLMTTPDLRAFVKALAALLQTGARFIATLSHPWFWPRYWGYDAEAWVSCAKKTFIEAPFVISRCRTEVRTTHVHRPLEQYVTVFSEAGFRLDALVEPMPSMEVEALYPKPWRFPRFIGLRWVKAV